MKNKCGILFSICCLILLSTLFLLGCQQEKTEIKEEVVQQIDETKPTITTTEIVYAPSDERYAYEVELLNIIMEKTKDKYGDYTLVPYHEKVSSGRRLLLLEKGDVDISISSVNKDRLARSMPVRVPLLQGLLGYRVFFIHEDNVDLMANVSTLDELKELTAGFGAKWGDFAMLKSNGLKVEGVDEHELIFNMLDKKRFEYFPRGINEIWAEFESHESEEHNIVIDQNLAFIYALQRFFFVQQGNTDLHDRLKEGLLIAKEDGSFEETFLKHYTDILEKANLENRKIFYLDNPTSEVTLDEIDTSWWLDKSIIQRSK